MAKKHFLLIAALALSATANLAQNVSKECYRGFFDGGYTIGAVDYTFNRFEVNTSHGYQITPSFFVGGGAGMHFMSSYETPSMVIPLDVRKSKVDIPLFVNARFNMSEGHYVPFLDVKAGKYITYEGGLYMNISLGCRIAMGEKNAVNVHVGYTTEQLEFETFYKFVSSSSMDYLRKGTLRNTEGIAVKIGYEF